MSYCEVTKDGLVSRGNDVCLCGLSNPDGKQRRSCAYPNGNPLGGFQRREWFTQHSHNNHKDYVVFGEVRTCEYPCNQLVGYLAAKKASGEEMIA